MKFTLPPLASLVAPAIVMARAAVAAGAAGRKR